MKESLEKAKNIDYTKIAGNLLIISGIGIPVTLLFITFWISSSNENGALIVIITIPMIIVAFWILPIVAGIRAKEKDHFVFVLVSCVIAFLYYILFDWIIIGLIYTQSLSIFYSIFLLLSLLPIAAFVLVFRSRKEFY